MSAELGTKGRVARSTAFGRRGSLTRHVGLRNSILQQDERVGEEYSAFRAALFYRWQIMDKWRTVS